MRKTLLLLIVVATVSSGLLANPPESRRRFIKACVATLALPFTSFHDSSAPEFGDVRWEIIGPDSKVPIKQGSLKFDPEQSVGGLTIQILEKENIPFKGDAGGIYSIFDSPTEDDALEVLSDTSMRSYGWCYEVNGVQPQVMPDKFFFQKSPITLRWFYGYIQYDQGVWARQCVPAFTVRGSFAG